MRKRKFDELMSYFNRKVSEMEIGTEYKIELLGMVTALGFAHEIEDVKPKKGHWTRPSRENTYERFCSECGGKAWCCGKGDYPFCPNCGAEMEGEANG